MRKEWKTLPRWNTYRYKKCISPESLKISRIIFCWPCMNSRNTLVPRSRNTVIWSMKVHEHDWRTVGNWPLYSSSSVTRWWARYIQLLWNNAETKKQGIHHKSLLTHLGYQRLHLWSKKPKAEEFGITLNCNNDSSCYSLLSVGWTTTSLNIQAEGVTPHLLQG
jgi:hypothetical protein